MATKAALREHLFIGNTADLVKRTEAGIYLSYRTQQLGRAYQSAAWQVLRPGYKTDPGGHWQDHGQKTFSVYQPREEKDAVLEQAKAWVSERYGIKGWERTPFGDYVPAGTMAKVDALLAEAKANPTPKLWTVRMLVPSSWPDERPEEQRHEAEVRLVANTRREAVQVLRATGAEVDPKDLRQGHPDGVRELEPRTVYAAIGVVGSMAQVPTLA